MLFICCRILGLPLHLFKRTVDHAMLGFWLSLIHSCVSEREIVNKCRLTLNELDIIGMGSVRL